VKTKKVTVYPVPTTDQAHEVLQELVTAHHPELEEAKIALLFNRSWKVSASGRLTLGKCKLASDLDRALSDFDVAIQLNEEFWLDDETTDEQRRALLDHELCHAKLRIDPETGDPLLNELGRRVYAIRPHDVEEFEDIIKRHGTYKRDLERFAAAMLTRRELDKLEGERT
jgi:hypothetical protein